MGGINEQQQTGGSDPFATPDLESINMNQIGGQDMTHEINNSHNSYNSHNSLMNGGVNDYNQMIGGESYGSMGAGSPGVFDSTYTTEMQESKNSNSDPYGLGDMPVNVTKLP